MERKPISSQGLQPWEAAGTCSSQELEELVNQVVFEINARLQQEEQQEKPGRKLPKGAQRDKLLVLGQVSREEEQALAAYFEVASDVSEKDWDMLLITQLSLETMAYAAGGIPGNREADCLLNSLLFGKKVFVWSQGFLYRQFRDTAAKTIYSLYMQQEDVLRNLGVEVITHVLDVAAVSRIPGHVTAEYGGFIDFTQLHLLREADLLKLRNAAGKTVKLGRNTKITPLAMDYITNHNLSIARQ